MLKFVIGFLSCFFMVVSAQNNNQDTIYLMNGLVIGEKVIDTALGSATIINPTKPSKKIVYEWDELYMIRFANGYKKYYYSQDSSVNNWLTRDQMWMYMKGENDARKGFKAKGAFIGGGISGIIGGVTGTFFGPIAPFGFMALNGITKIKIRHKTLSNPAFVDSDAYLMGYERVARQKRKLKSWYGGTVGLALGYCFFAIFRPAYPETINFSFK